LINKEKKMRNKINAGFTFTMLLVFTGLLFAGSSFKYPQPLNAPYAGYFPGQHSISPANPFTFSGQVNNPSAFYFFPDLGYINGDVGLHPNSISSYHLSAGFNTGNGFYLGFRVSTLSFATGVGYDYSTNGYRTDAGRLIEPFYSGALDVAYGIGNKVSIGLSLKYFDESTLQGAASGFSSDLSVTAGNIVPDLTLAVLLTNIGPIMDFPDTSVAQPSTVYFSAAYDLKLGSLALYPQLSLRSSDLNGLEIIPSVGIRPMKSLTFQLGASLAGNQNDYPWSGGINYEFGSFNFNYKLAGTADGEIAHFAGISFRFKKKKEPAFKPRVKKARVIKGKKVIADSLINARPPAPRNTRLREEGEMLILEWDPAFQGDKYEVYAKLGKTSVFRKVTKTPLTVEEFRIKKPRTTIPLFLYVKTVRGKNSSEPSRVVSFYPESD
jgi:hypothetical protein